MNQNYLLALLLLFGAASFCSAAPSQQQSFCTPDKFGSSEKLNFNELPGRFIYIDFWASWCEPCRESFPFLNDLKKQFESKGVTVVGINVDKHSEDAVKFMNGNKPNFIIASDTGGACAKTMNLKAMPSSYILNQAGEVVYEQKGFRRADIDKIKEKIQQLLDGNEGQK